MSAKTPDIIPYGDSALLVQYKVEGFSEDVSSAVHALAAELREEPHWTELVPGYDSLLCVFNLTEISVEAAKVQLEKALVEAQPAQKSNGRIIEIPVVYGGEYGPDMNALKKSSGLSRTDIIKQHSAEPYLVCMMGFIPGFSFLSEAPKALHHPRHATPRAKVPAGSIGIAGWQTGIYGLESPGGWQIIGRTPIKMFDKTRDKPFLLEAGDRVKFVPSKPGIFS